MFSLDVVGLCVDYLVYVPYAEKLANEDNYSKPLQLFAPYVCACLFPTTHLCGARLQIWRSVGSTTLSIVQENCTDDYSVRLLCCCAVVLFCSFSFCCSDLYDTAGDSRETNRQLRRVQSLRSMMFDVRVWCLCVTVCVSSWLNA